MSFEEAGIRLSVKGADDFFGSLKSAEKAVADFGVNVSKQANLTGFAQDINAVNSAFKATASAATSAATAVNKSAAATGAATLTANTLATATIKTQGAATSQASAFSAATGAIGNFAGAVGGAVAKLPGLAADAAIGGVKALAGAAGSAVGALGNMASAAGGAVVDGFKGIASAALSAAGAIASMAVDGAKKVASMGFAFAKTSVGAFTDFSQKISGIAAVSGATAEEMQQMTDKALELGAKFPVSASQAADAMANLASAGFTARDAIGASASVVLLAGAGQLDMAKSADILSSSMNGFGLITADANKNIAEAARVTDLMAATANASAVSITDIGSTMKYVAPTAKAAGYSIEDMSKAIGMMGNAGIKGSSAGTALRSIIVGLTASAGPSADALKDLGVSTADAAGNTRPYADVIGDLRAKFKDLSQADKIDFAKKIAGKEAMSGFLSIVDASQESYDNMGKSIDSATGKAKTMADTMNNNLAGKLSNMQGSIETLQIKFGKALAPAVGLAYDAIASLANKLGPFADTLAPKVSGALDTMQDLANKAASGFSLFLGAFNSGFVVPPAWDGLAATMGRLGTALAPLKGAVTDLVTAILPAAQPAQSMADALGNAGVSATNAHPVIDAISGLVTNFLVPGIERAGVVVNELQAAFGMAQTALAPFLPTIGDLAGKALAVYQAVSPLNIVLTAFEGFMTGGLPGAVAALGGNVTSLGNAFGVDLSGPVNTVVTFITTQLVPGITSIASTVMTVLPQVISFGQSFLSTVLPPITSFVGWIVANVGPMVSSAFNTFGTVVLPALGRFVDFVGTTVIPRVSDFVSTIATKVQPILETGFSIITTSVIPTLGKLVAVVMDDVIPILTDWWGVIATVLTPVFDVLVGAIQNFVLPAAKAIWGFINDPLIPVFKTIANVVKTVVIPALQDMANFFNNTVKKAIDTIVGVWDGFTQRIGDGASAIGKIFSGDLAGAADDLQKAVVGRTGEAGAATSAFATAVTLASGEAKTSLQNTATDFTDLNKTVDDKTLAMDTRITDFSINTRDESQKTTEKVSALGTAYTDVGTKATDTTPKVNDFASAATATVTPSENAATAASNSGKAFQDVSIYADLAKVSMDKYNQTAVPDKQVNTNFSAVYSAIDSAVKRLENWNNTPVNNKNATYTTSYVTTGNPNPPSPPGNAGGTDFWRGGASTLAEKGPEAIKEPGKPAWLAMQPMFHPDLARGSKVFNAQDTANMLGGRVDHPASAQQIMQSATYNNYTSQKVLNVTSMQSTGDVISDYGLIEVLA